MFFLSFSLHTYDRSVYYSSSQERVKRAFRQKMIGKKTYGHTAVKWGLFRRTKQSGPLASSHQLMLDKLFTDTLFSLSSRRERLIKIKNSGELNDR